MADMTVKLGSASADLAMYQDGDIVELWTDRHILHENAFIVCDPRKATTNADGLRSSALSQQYCEEIYEYRFEHISRFEVRRTELSTGKAEVFSNVPTAAGDYFRDAEDLVRRWKAHTRHQMFGSLGAEVWYGGKQDKSVSNVSNVWDAIEATSLQVRADHTRKHLGPVMQKHFLVLPVIAVTEQVAARAVAIEPDYDDQQPEFNPVLSIGNQTARKRRAHLGWRAMGLPESESRILDRDVLSDFRERIAPVDLTTVAIKPRINMWSVRGHLVDDSKLFPGT